jgi:hypothetical protein
MLYMISTNRGNRVVYSTQSYFHSYRVQVIARLPESEYKRAALKSARTALNGQLAFEQATAKTKEAGLCCKLE